MINNKLTIVADENIPAVEDMFSEFGSITKVDGRSLTAEALKGADVLLVRSVTQVNERLLTHSSVKFVGSATIGVDHIDTKYLQQEGIHFSNAPGCNADAVVEYDINCFSELLAQSNENLIDQTIAIIGVGNVGRKLAMRLSNLGVAKILLNDPPRSATQPGFSSLEHCLKNADLIAMHTPMITQGEWPTKHLISKKQLNWLKPNAILLNAGRGGAIKADDLLAFLKQRSDVKTVLDVWEHEPKVDQELAGFIDIATPHIAGHTLEGKVRGTFMLKEAFCQWLGIDTKNSLEEYLPVAPISSVGITKRADFLSILRTVYDPFRDDRALRATLSSSEQALKFDVLRKQYPERREFYSLQVSGEISSAMHRDLSNYGFCVTTKKSSQ